jgi:hypothetical protein
MGYMRKLGWLTLGFALFVSAPVIAGPAEPLIVTQLHDPDPGYVPPASERKSGKRLANNESESSAIDAAMQEFGRAIGQAAMAQQQSIEARCKSDTAAADRPSDRFAWAAACQYQRR